MKQQNRPEVHLEVCGGFFRIPTDKVVYNITVLDSDRRSMAQVPLPSNTSQSESRELSGEGLAPSFGYQKGPDRQGVPDNFYREAAIYYSGEFNRLVGGGSSFGAGESGGAGAVRPLSHPSGQPFSDALERLDQTRKSVENAKLIFSDIQEQLSRMQEKGQEVPDGRRGDSSLAEGAKDIQAKVGKLKGVLAASFKKASSVPPEQTVLDTVTKEMPAKTRYLFELDTVFQTIYELCTNETVKEHSQKARASASDLFNREEFLDYLSERVPTYTEDDGFLSIPLVDVLTGLAKSCSDKKTVNLLKNMNKQQESIFLDQFLPLEKPGTEEVAVEGPPEGEEAAGETEDVEVVPVPEVLPEEVRGLLDSIEVALESLVQRAEGPGEIVREKISGGVDDEVISKLGYASHILADVGNHIIWVRGEIGNKSSNALSGGKPDGLLLEIKKTAEAMAQSLEEKKVDPDLPFSPNRPVEEPSLELEPEDMGVFEEEGGEDFDRQDDFDKMMSEVSLEEELTEEALDDSGGQTESAEEDSPNTNGAVEVDENYGEASQEDIDKLLEELGG